MFARILVRESNPCRRPKDAMPSSKLTRRRRFYLSVFRSKVVGVVRLGEASSSLESQPSLSLSRRKRDLAKKVLITLVEWPAP